MSPAAGAASLNISRSQAVATSTIVSEQHHIHSANLRGSEVRDLEYIAAANYYTSERYTIAR